MAEKLNTFVLPYPPSINHYWRSIGNGRVLISKEGREYRSTVCSLLFGSARLRGRLAISILATMPDKRKRDLDNIAKALLDALGHAGVYDDDSQIDDLRIVRSDVAKPGRIIAEISEICNG